MSMLRRTVVWMSVAAVAVLVASGSLATHGVATAGSVGRARAVASVKAVGHVGGAIHQIATVKLPSRYTQPTSFDISSFDPQTQTYYLSDRTNTGVDAIKASANSFAGIVGHASFAGSGAAATVAQKSTCGPLGVQGPNGNLVLRVGGVRQLWASDGVTASSPSSSVKVFNLTAPGSGTLATTVPTRGLCRADELSYDARDRVVMVANDLDAPPYVSFISVNRDPAKDRVIGTIKLPRAIDGIEQSVWDPGNNRFYLNIPQVPSSNGAWRGEVAVIDPRTRSIGRTFPVRGCSPAGLALDPKPQRLLLGCSGDAISGHTVAGVRYRPNPGVTYVMNAHNGQIVASLRQVSGSDEVWFDPGSERYYLGAETMTSNGKSTGYPTPVLGVISARNNRWIENFPTAASAHSLAVNPSNRHALVPIPGYGIAVFGAAPGR
jgi:hypothetical protein